MVSVLLLLLIPLALLVNAADLQDTFEQTPLNGEISSCLIHNPDGSCPSYLEAAQCLRYGGIEVSQPGSSTQFNKGNLTLASATLALQAMKLEPIWTGEVDGDNNDLYEQTFIISYYIAPVGQEPASYRLDVYDSNRAQKPDIFQEPGDNQLASIAGGSHVAAYKVIRTTFAVAPSEEPETKSPLKYAALYVQMKDVDGHTFNRRVVYEFCIPKPEGCEVSVE